MTGAAFGCASDIAVLAMSPTPIEPCTMMSRSKHTASKLAGKLQRKLRHVFGVCVLFVSETQSLRKLNALAKQTVQHQLVFPRHPAFTV